MLGAREGLDAALGWTPPQLKEGKAGKAGGNGGGDWYVEFYAFDPALGRLRRKRVKVNRVKGSVAERREYGLGVCRRLWDLLNRGWNPWVGGMADDLATMEEALGRWDGYLERMMSGGYFRKETYVGYRSNVKILREFIAERGGCHYAYQFDRGYCVAFLDWVFVDRNCGAQTRNNYLNFLRVLGGFMVEKGFLKQKPTEGIQPISRRLYRKEREVIPADVVGRIADWCRRHEPRFLLACYLLYYCFIRPVEMMRLRVRDFNVKASTVTVRGECSKNKRTQSVTVPKRVMSYAFELGVFSAPLDDYVFSWKLQPGKDEMDPKLFRDYWAKVRRGLGLRAEWKFYSLKDTGITEMLRRGEMAAIEVRDQARHSSLAITEIYTDRSGQANGEILEWEGSL